MHDDPSIIRTHATTGAYIAKLHEFEHWPARWMWPMLIATVALGAAAAAAFAGIVGTGLAIAAAQNRREYYDSYGYYGAAPVYYGGGPAYYGGPVYYGGGPYYYGREQYYGGYRDPNSGW